jgi:hydrogenase expression/formation protein HypD
VATINKAIAIAARPEVIFCSFGDMLRVPGSTRDLLAVKAGGGDVRVVYSPLDALALARRNPERQVVFFAIGFETTAPANAAVVVQARREGLTNFSLLVSQVRVPPAIAAILAAPGCRVQGFLAAGHVCAVMGYHEYHPLAERHHVPIVVTGFEPLDILQGILYCVQQLESGQAGVTNAYTRAVTEAGNEPAQRMIRDVFRLVDWSWRGIGLIPASGLALAAPFAQFDAERRFNIAGIATAESPLCISGLILQGRKKPGDCPAFGRACTPEHPLGATMVSAEGACAAYYHYRPPGKERASGNSNQ